MIRRWLILWIEFLIFIIIFALGGFLYIEPHLKREFEEVVSQRFGLDARVDYFYFSPTGKIQGRNLSLSGNVEGVGEVSLLIDKFLIEPQERIYERIYKDKEDFDWKKLSYKVDFEKLVIDTNQVYVDVPTLNMDLSEHEGKVDIEEFFADTPTHRVNAEEFKASFDLRIEKHADFMDLISALNVEGLQIETKKVEKKESLFGDIIKQLGLKPVQEEEQQKPIDVSSFRMMRMLDDWDVKGNGSWSEKKLFLSGKLKRLKNGYWQFSGEEKMDFIDRKLQYLVRGPLKPTGPWDVELRDSDNNLFELRLTSKLQEWIGTWKLDMQHLSWKGLEGPAIAGKMQGGFSFLDAEKSGKVHLEIEDLSGGPKNTSSANLSLDLSFDKSKVSINTLTVQENGKWSGNASGAFDLTTMSPNELELKLFDFPLDQYSLQTGGKMNIDAKVKGKELDLKIRSEAMYPNKDPLLELKNFKIDLLVGQEKVDFHLDFSQSGHNNVLEAEIQVKDLLFQPFKVREGVLSRFESKSQLFDLALKEQVKADINLLGMKLNQFHIDDRNQRLRHIKGKAYVPFLRPPTLNIEASGFLEMDNFPPIVSSPLKGRIYIKNAKWDKGWSLRNLIADLEGNALQFQPAAVFPKEINISKYKGRFEGMKIITTHLDGHTESAAKFNASGVYDLPERKMDIFLTGENINYESKEYIMRYNIRDLRVKGEVQDLKISGNADISYFQYTEEFSIANDDDKISRPNITPPEALSFRHYLDLNMRSINPLSLNNNVGPLTFTVPKLRLYGPLLKPSWEGTIVSTKSDANRLSIPIQFIDVSFKVKEVQLKFQGEEEWNPTYKLRAEKEIKGEVVDIVFDGKMDKFTRGDFNLSSSTGYSREAIITMLTTGDLPKEGFFQEKTGKEEEKEIEGFVWFTKEFKPGPLNHTNYQARITSGSDPFEFSVDYALTKSIQAEIAQKSENNTFIGLRFSKRFDHWSALFKFDRLEKRKSKKEHRIIWDLKGLPDNKRSPSGSRLRVQLKKIEPLLHEGKYAEARKVLTETLNAYLAYQGFVDGKYHVSEIATEIKQKSRFASSAVTKVKQTTIKIECFPGNRFSIASVYLSGWPEEVPKFSDPWLKKTKMLRVLYDKDRMDTFKDKAMAQLAEYGYPSAKIKLLEVSRLKMDKLKKLDDKTPFHVKEKGFSRETRKKDSSVPVVIHVRFDPGEIHSVEQLYIKGLKSLTPAEAKKIMKFEVKMDYSETRFEKFRKHLMKWYDDQGFFDTKITYRVLISRRYPRTSLHFTVEEGKRWMIRNISFKGLKKTKPEAITGYLRVAEGTWAIAKKIDASINELNRLGVFESIQVAFKEVGEGEKDIIFEVKEKPRVNFSARIGYETTEGLQGSVRIRLQNITKLGRSISLENDFSSKETIRKLVFSDSLFDKRNIAAQIAGGEKIELITTDEIKNRQRLFEIGFIKNIQDISSQSLFLAYQQDRNQTSRIPSLRLRFRGDFRKARASESPQAGFGLLSRSTLATYTNDNFNAYYGDYTFSYGMKMGSSLVTPWLRYGHTVKLGKNFKVPLADRSFLGGTQSLRGYKEDEISGNNRDGGESLVSFGVQLFYPIQSWIDGTVFIDSGRVYDGESGGRWKNFFTSGGVGSVLRTPVGPIQMFVAKPTNSRPLRFGIQLGTIF